jgi:hypothetical protein
MLCALVKHAEEPFGAAWVLTVYDGKVICSSKYMVSALEGYTPKDVQEYLGIGRWEVFGYLDVDTGAVTLKEGYFIG